MKRTDFLRRALLLFCVLCTVMLVGCASADGGYTLVSTDAAVRPDAAEQITVTERSYIEVTTEATTARTEPPEVVVTGTSAPAVTTRRPETEAPKEHYTVKFVDSDGYTTVSLQSVAEGDSATAPTMPEKKGDLYFRGWNRDFSDVRRSMIVTAVYEKELFTVRFFDYDGTLLRSETVHWGEDAQAPEVADRGNLIFNGWSTLFNSVHTDLDVYATYYVPPQPETMSLVSAYSGMSYTENILDMDTDLYSRMTYGGTFTLNDTVYSGRRLLYGCFADTFAVEGYGYDGFSGQLVFTGLPTAAAGKTYSILLLLYCDDTEVFRAELSSPGTSETFDVSLTDVNELTIVLEPMVNGILDEEGTAFIGGILDGAFYKEN